MARRRTHYKKGPRKVTTLAWKAGVLAELEARGIPVHKMEKDIGAGDSSIAKMLRSDEEGTSAYVDAINAYLGKSSPELTAEELDFIQRRRGWSPEVREAINILIQRSDKH